MKKGIICFIISVLVIVFAYVIISSALNDNKPNAQGLNEGKDISKEDYVFKEDLLALGYSINDIKVIQNKLNETDVKKYLLSVKYDNLISFISSPYFNVAHIERYEEYYKKNESYSFEEIVMYTEIGLDKEFYTGITTITNYNDTSALVNKYNQLPKDVKYDDIVTIEKPYSSDGKRQTRKVAYDAFKQMADDAAKDGIKIWVVSGFRTWDQQTSLFNNSEKKNGLNHALIYSAKPGHSEHQLGLALDLNTTDENKHFENSKEYEWLKQNSYKYGFIERYKKDKEFITGYAFEPWHYRYLGVDIATKLFEENITYEEFLVKYNKELLNNN